MPPDEIIDIIRRRLPYSETYTRFYIAVDQKTAFSCNTWNHRNIGMELIFFLNKIISKLAQNKEFYYPRPVTNIRKLWMFYNLDIHDWN